MLLVDRRARQCGLELGAVEPDLHRDVGEHFALDDAPALLVVRVLDAAQHRQRLGAIDRLRREHRGGRRPRIEHHRGVEQQAVVILAPETLAAHLRDPLIGLSDVEARRLRQLRRLGPERAAVQIELDVGHLRRGPHQGLGAVAPAAERIINIVQRRAHSSISMLPTSPFPISEGPPSNTSASCAASAP